MERAPSGLRHPQSRRRVRLGGAHGDSDFETLVVPYVQRLYRFLVLRLGDERDARDALQETLLAAWQGLPRLRERDRPWSWLVGIAAHKAADSSRGRFRAIQPGGLAEAHEDADDG